MEKEEEKEMMPLCDRDIIPQEEFPEYVIDEMLDDDFGPDNSDEEDNDDG